MEPKEPLTNVGILNPNTAPLEDVALVEPAESTHPNIGDPANEGNSKLFEVIDLQEEPSEV